MSKDLDYLQIAEHVIFWCLIPTNGNPFEGDDQLTVMFSDQLIKELEPSSTQKETARLITKIYSLQTTGSIDQEPLLPFFEDEHV